MAAPGPDGAPLAMAQEKEKILVIDDEVEIAEFIKKYLLREGYCVYCGYNAGDALRLIRENKPDVIILDIMLPDTNGTEFCHYLRSEGIYTPVLLISAKDDDADKVLGLGLGADDYITKPFSPNELVARVKAHLRRNKILMARYKDTSVLLTFATMEIDVKRREVTVNGEPVYLTAKEFDLLVFLAKNPNQVFNRSQLYEKIWGLEACGDDRTVMVHIRNLRGKIEKDMSHPKYIKTVWGVGYKFNPF